MKILYGVQATGAGHIARSRIMLESLQKFGIQVDFLFSGGAKNQLFDMEVFGNFIYKQGLTLSLADGKVDKLKTLAQSKAKNFFQDVKDLELNNYDLVLTDFEPISAWAAKLRKIPTIGLANQYTLVNKITNLDIKTPKAMRLGIKSFAPADIYFGIHWQKLGANVIPPLTQKIFTQEQIKNTKNQDFYLVYLPNENISKVLSFVKNFTAENFIIYTPLVASLQTQANIQLKPLARQNFLQDILHSKGIICNTGFGLCTEAMQLGKKILTKPLQGQFEQGLNAEVLRKLHRAEVMQNFDAEITARWFAAKSYKPQTFPNTADAIVKWIKNGCEAPVDKLIANLWNFKKSKLKNKNSVLDKNRNLSTKIDFQIGYAS